MWESSSAMKLGSRANGSYEGIWNQVVQFFKKANAFAVETRARRIGVQHLALRATPFAKEAIHHVQRSGSTGNLFGLSPDRCCHTTILGSC